MYGFLAVAAGGAIGASLRHLVNLAGLRFLGPGFPWATMVVNIAGCLAMGLAVEIMARRTGLSPEIRLFLITGILGGFTTFSAFALDVGFLYEKGAIWQAFLYGTASVVVSLAAFFLGLWLARSLA